METIKLNASQAEMLFETKELYLNSYKILNFFENKLIYHEQGVKYELESLTLEFKYKECDDAFMEDFKYLLCDHLNLRPYEVVFKHHNEQERVFDVKLANTTTSIVICNKQNAIANTYGIEDDPEKYISDDQIGIYKRLGNSHYYFRWFDSSCD